MATLNTVIAVLAGTVLEAATWARQRGIARRGWYYAASPAAAAGHHPSGTVVLPGFAVRRTHDAVPIVTAVRRDLAKVPDGPALTALLDRQLAAVDPSTPWPR